MKVDTEVKEQKEQKEEERKPETPQFYDIESSYLYWRNYIPETPYQEYTAKKNCVAMGKELLRPEGGRKEEILKVYNKAIEALEEATPKNRKIIFGNQNIAGHYYKLYWLTADDAGNCQAERESLDDVKMDFKNQQYETIVKNLQEVDDEIFHELVLSRVIPVEALNPKRIMDKVLREGGFDVLFKENIPDKKLNGRKEIKKSMNPVSTNSDIIPAGTADEEISSGEEPENEKAKE